MYWGKNIHPGHVAIILPDVDFNMIFKKKASMFAEELNTDNTNLISRGK